MENYGQIFAVVQSKVEKIPYAEENDEYMPEYLRVYSESAEIEFDPKRDFTFDSWEELVSDVYARRGMNTPLPIQPLDNLMGQVIDTPDGGQLFIDGVDTYLHCYNLEIADIYWIRLLPVYAAFCTTEEAANFYPAARRGVMGITGEVCSAQL